MKYRIPLLQPTDPKKLNNKEGLREDACISLRMGNKIFNREWREGTGWRREYGNEQDVKD